MSSPDGRIDREEWPSVWCASGSEWPVTSETSYPLVHSGTEAWLHTVRMEPNLLLHHVRRFVFPDELLASLADKVIVQWTSKWRQECLLSGLQAYRLRVKDITTSQWLDQWISRAQWG